MDGNTELLPGFDGDQGDANEAEQDAEPAPAAQLFIQKPGCQQGDEDRLRGDDQAGCPGGHGLFPGVQGDIVESNPQETHQRQAGNVFQIREGHTRHHGIDQKASGGRQIAQQGDDLR